MEWLRVILVLRAAAAAYIWFAASSRYAIGQLQRALDSLAAAQDATSVARAETKIVRWRSVIAGMAEGSVSVGSRTPVSGTPAWVTLEVAHGGFATGRLLAEAPLDAQDQLLLAGLPEDVPGLSGRERLNSWFLGDAGQRDLLRVLAGGRGVTISGGRQCDTADFSPWNVGTAS